MSTIRSRKHALANQPLLNQSLFALATLGLPLAAHAQATDKTMAEIKVEAAADVPYKADKVSSPKLTQPLLDTTQTITVIKKEVFQEQAATSIMEALQNTPGITLQLGENGNTSAGDTFQMRGFSAQSSIFVDGIRDLGGISRDVFNIEQIEVAKGPSGADIGRGAAAGYINLASKLPTREDANSGQVSYNSGEKARGSLDINRKFGETGAFRINLLTEDGGNMGRKVIEKSRHGIAPSVALGLGTATRFYAYSQHVRQDGTPDGGIPAVGLQGFNQTSAAQARNAPRVDRESFYGYNSDYEKMDADMATIKIEHDFDAKTRLTNTSRYGKSKIDRILTGVNGIISSAPSMANWTVTRTRQSVLQENEIMGNTTNVVTEFATGGIGHTVSAGLEFLSEQQLAPTRVGLGTAVPVNGVTPALTANLYAPNRNDALAAYKPVLNGAFTKGKTTTVAAYAFDTIKLNDQWQLNAGLRAEHYTTETASATAAGTGQTASFLEKTDQLTSWKLGGLYKPADNASVYLAYATSQTPPGSANFTLSSAVGNVAGPAMDPQKTTNLELGTKWDVLAKQLALTAALYRTENKNEFTLEDPVAHTYSQLGKRRVQGIELGAVGQITRNWSIIAGLTTMDAEILQGTTAGNGAGAGTRWTPELSATLWTTYKLNNALSIGGGVRYMSEQKRLIDPTADASLQNTPGIPSYAVVDAVVSYKVHKNVTLQLNLYNLFDRFYVSTLNNGGSRAVIGSDRAGQLTASFLF